MTAIHSFVTRAALFAAALSAGSRALPAAPASSLHDAIRLGQTSTWRAALEKKPDLDARDASGNTPLHVAALRNDADAVDALLARGANVAAVNTAGATPLHYGTGSERIVKALLAKGANVELACTEGRTPLFTALARPDCFPVVKLLVDAGASVKTAVQSGRRRQPNVLAAAISSGDRRVVKLLVERGADVNATTGFTPLHAAAFYGDVESTRLLLDHGASIDGSPVFAGTPLNTALYAGQKDVAALLIARGADLKAPSPMGHATPPMVFAAYNETGDATIARLLVQRGVDVNATNEYGENALTYALRRGPDTELVRFLREKGAKETALPTRTPALPLAGTGDIPADTNARAALIRERVQRSVAVLQRGSHGFLENSFVKKAACISCHQQTLPAVALAWAGNAGLSVDETEFGRQLHAELAMIGPRAEAARQANEPVPDSFVSIGYSLDALAAVNYPADEITDAMAHFFLATQRREGWWPSYDRRPPMEDGPIVGTAWVARSLALYPLRGREADTSAALARARTWMAAQQPSSLNERVFQLLGLAWAGESPRALQPLAERLLREQRPDGSWTQHAGLESDSWATGSALVALFKAGYPTSDLAYQRGVTFLLRTQFADGSWRVRTRSWGFQPHFDGQFPHGKDQWISAAGTAWAAMALLLSVDSKIPSAPHLNARALMAKYTPPTAKPAPGETSVTSSAENARSAAGADGSNDATSAVASKVVFARDIKPLIERSCADCHAGEKVRGGFSLASRDHLLKGGNSGEPAVVPGRSHASQLVAYVSDKVEDLEMPPLGKREKYPALNANEIALLRAWIDSGADWATP